MKQGSLAFCGAASILVVFAALTDRLPVGLNPAQAIGILCAAWNTWLTAARSLWNWPVGIASCLIFASVFGHAGLYGSMSMQLFYALSSVIGWRWWLRGGDRGGPLLVRQAPAALLSALIFTAAALATLLMLLLKALRDAAPLPDSLATILNLCGQLLVMRKCVENWYFWMAADIISASMYLWLHLPMMGILYIVHVLMCAYGLWQWKRDPGILAACPSDPVLT